METTNQEIETNGFLYCYTQKEIRRSTNLHCRPARNCRRKNVYQPSISILGTTAGPVASVLVAPGNRNKHTASIPRNINWTHSASIMHPHLHPRYENGGILLFKHETVLAGVESVWHRLCRRGGC